MPKIAIPEWKETNPFPLERKYFKARKRDIFFTRILYQF
jgi:hypothetical protein